MGGTRNIMVRAGADFSQLSQAFQRVQSEASGFASHITSKLGMIGLAVEGIKGIGEAIVHSIEGIGEFAKQAGELDGRLSSLNSRLGASANQFMQWGDTVGKQAGLSKAFMIEEGASLTAMLETQATSQQDLANKTETMMKNIAIISSATGRDIKTVSEAVTSALSGHTSALTSYDFKLQVASLRSSEAYKQIAGNAPWARLTQQQKEAIMYTEINRQTLSLFGSEVVEDTATRMNRFTSALSDVKSNLEQAFQPILYRVLPILDTLIARINNALQYVTAFFQVLFGYSGAQVKSNTGALNDQANAVENLANAHGKLNSATAGRIGGSGVAAPKIGSGDHALRGNGAGTVGGGKKLGTGFVASFDQVHTITEKAGSGSGSAGSGVGGAGGAGGGADMGGLGELAKSPSSIGNAMDAMRNKVAGTVESITNTFGKAISFLQQHAAVIKSVLAGLEAGIATFLIGSNWGAIVEGLAAAFEALAAAIASISLPVLAVAAGVALLIGNLVYLWETNKGFRDSVIQVWNEISGFAKQVFNDMWSIVKKTWDKYGEDIWKGVQGFMKSIQDIILNVWNNFVKPILMDGIKALRDLWDNHLKALVAQVLDFAGKLIASALEIWNKFISPIANWLIQTLGPIFAYVFGDIFKIIGKVGGVIADVATGIFKALGGVIDFLTGVFTGNWSKAWTGIKEIVGGIFQGFEAIIKPPINAIIDIIDSAIDKINGLKNTIPGASNILPDIPRIHHLANGGITNGPMMAVVGDNIGGQEVVTPLDRLQSMMASTVSQTINTVMSMQRGTGNNVSGDIVLNIDGRTFARIVKPWLDMENKRVGTNIRLQSI